MSFEDDLLGEFVIEANEHLADVENQFLAIEEMGASVDVNLVNEVFRAIHSIKGAAGFLGMTKINDLAHSLENVLNMMRNHELAPNSQIVDVMLKSADKLQGLINDIQNSNDADVSDHVTKLDAIAAGQVVEAPAPAAKKSPGKKGAPAKKAAPAPKKPRGGKAKAAPEPSVEDELDLDAQIEAALGAAHAAREAASAAELQGVAPASDPAPTPPTAVEPLASPATAAAPASAEGDKKPASPVAETNIRVSVGLLDKLMNLAGELVLSRNQLMQAISAADNGGLEGIAARLDQVTSELQESIMQTRMQQIGTVFGRFPRVVRDLGAKLNKECELTIEGKEVEVDKTIVEAIGDPLTHLIRNSMDHGIETPERRIAAGKSPQGTLHLRAFYQAGKVRLEIQDDGAGIDPRKLREKAAAKGIITPEQAEQMSDRDAVRLIFHPGFSMAAQVTDVSGRGVGMDVVRTNIAKLGGTVDVESVVGKGTSVVVTLPLTLAIIPSLIVQSGSDRFAIPQVNIAELVRIRPHEMNERLGRVKDAEVLRLRGSLLPIVRLGSALGTPLAENERADERHAEPAATNIIVVESGRQRFGIVVDGLHDSEEIVVKPLGRHIKGCISLSGATILGDGHVALILDVAGLAVKQAIGSCDGKPEDKDEATRVQQSEDLQSVLLFTNDPNEHFAVCMDVVSRIERVRVDQIDSVGGKELVQYRNSTMPLVRLENTVTAKPGPAGNQVYVVVFEAAGKEVALIAPELEDIRDVPVDFDTVTFREPGVPGSMVINGRATRLVDLHALAEIAYPEWFQDQPVAASDEGLPALILLAEDSGFFRKQVAGLFVEKGYRVVEAEDGLEAWQILQSGEHAFDVIVTDIEMPNMNGFELCRNIKQSAQFGHLPVIALTSLGGAADVQHGLEVGIDDYQIKMDRDRLMNAVHNFAGQKTGNNSPKVRQLAHA
ncbi:MAG: chemotaxis protein CheW [Pirellulales bacterium]|nr:chemotaxis protein CheW [Pirellulales bacterium]